MAAFDPAGQPPAAFCAEAAQRGFDAAVQEMRDHVVLGMGVMEEGLVLATDKGALLAYSLDPLAGPGLWEHGSTPVIRSAGSSRTTTKPAYSLAVGQRLVYW